jgi:hypothetical protein
MYLIVKCLKIYYQCSYTSCSPDIPENNLYFKIKTPVIYQLQLGTISSSAAVKLGSISSLEYCVNVQCNAEIEMSSNKTTRLTEA